MGQPKTDTELVVELIEGIEELIGAVVETRLRLKTLAARGDLVSRNAILEILDIIELTDGVVE